MPPTAAKFVSVRNRAMCPCQPRSSMQSWSVKKMNSCPTARAFATATFRARAGPPLVSNTMCSTSRSAREYFSGLASSTT